MASSEALGEVREARTPTARIRYRERGQGPPVVFVHGVLVNGDLWRQVVPSLVEAGFRCITPDWPFGAHDIAAPDADLSPPGAAALLAGFLSELGIDDASIIANDTGGAITQILLARHPEMVGRVVLTSSDAFERFPPAAFSFLPALGRVPGAVWLLAQALRLGVLHRLPFAFGWAAKHPIPPRVRESYLVPSRRDGAIRADLRRFVAGMHKRHTIAAAERLPAFGGPVLLAWAREDRLFPVSLAERLATVLPRAGVRLIEDSYTFIPEDQPEELGRIVVEFLRVNATTEPG